MKTAFLLTFLLLSSCSYLRDLPDDPEKLVQMLVLSEREAYFAPVYTDSVHESSFKASGKLRSMGVDAFPVLIANIDDKRLAASMGDCLPCDLGSACCRIIKSQVECDMPKALSIYEFLVPDDLPLWWGERNDDTLREMQVEAAFFGLAAAKYDKNTQAINILEKRLVELGINDFDEGTAKYINKFEAHIIPQETFALIDMLQVKGDTYIERRISHFFSGKAYEKLLQMGLDVFDLLVKNTNQPGEVGEKCFRILQCQVEALDRPYLEKFQFLQKNSIEKWWSERKAKSLRELQIEAAKYSLARVDATTFENEENKKSLIHFLENRLMEIKGKEGD